MPFTMFEYWWNSFPEIPFLQSINSVQWIPQWCNGIGGSFSSSLLGFGRGYVKYTMKTKEINSPWAWEGGNNSNIILAGPEHFHAAMVKMKLKLIWKSLTQQHTLPWNYSWKEHISHSPFCHIVFRNKVNYNLNIISGHKTSVREANWHITVANSEIRLGSGRNMISMRFTCRLKISLFS